MQILLTSYVGANARPSRFTSHSPVVLSQNAARLSGDVFTSTGRAQLQPKVRFSGWFNRSNPEIEVPMGSTYQAAGKDHRREILTTKSLMSCSALVYLGKYDPAKDKYRTRIVSHLKGSNLDMNVSGEKAGELALYMLALVNEDPTSRMCWVYGNDVSPYSKEHILSQEYNGRQPILECQQLLGERFETKQGIDIRVTPRGAVEITR